MPVLTRSALAESPLADLHLIAKELGLDGYRRLRKHELIDLILERQGGADDAPAEAAQPAEAAAPKPRRARRRRRDADDEDSSDEQPEAKAEAKPEKKAERSASSNGRAREETSIEGPITIQQGGSGLIEAGDGPSVFVSAAQVRRCELVDGDVVGGPARAPRRSERHRSLIRVETINGAPADEVAVGTPFDELACELPNQGFALPGNLSTTAPIGRGSRVTISGGPLSGKTELLRAIAQTIAAGEGVEVGVVLAGSRPEEVAAWRALGVSVEAAVPLPSPPEARGRAVEAAIDGGRRKAVRGEHVVLLIDTINGLDRPVARRALGAARNLTGGGSLTVIATSAEPLGGETTLIALQRPADGQYPQLDGAVSGTVRADLLAG